MRSRNGFRRSDIDVIGESERIGERYRLLLRRVEEACRRVGRDPSEVTILGVTKTQSASTVCAALDAGILDLGENYVQEFLGKREEVEKREGAHPRWHFIGHLQRNKVKYLLPHVYMIHGVDSLRLAEEIDRQARLAGRPLPVLLQVNTSGEDSKFGCDPADILSLGTAMAGMKGLDFQGMMTLAAFLDDPELLRPMFRTLREGRDLLRRETGLSLPHLSMGMTNDFEVAVEEGATLVRIGTALFGSRR